MPSFQLYPSSIYFNVSFSYAVVLLFFTVLLSHTLFVKLSPLFCFLFPCVAWIISHVLVSIRIRQQYWLVCKPACDFVLYCAYWLKWHIGIHFRSNFKNYKIYLRRPAKGIGTGILSNHSWWPNCLELIDYDNNKKEKKLFVQCITTVESRHSASFTVEKLPHRLMFLKSRRVEMLFKTYSMRIELFLKHIVIVLVCALFYFVPAKLFFASVVFRLYIIFIHKWVCGE